MIIGRVQNREAIVELEIASDSGTFPIESVIDTGYNGQLTLPESVITNLGLPFAGHRRGLLADGSISILSVFIGRILWHDQLKEVIITQTSGTSLIGMELLEGN